MKYVTMSMTFKANHRIMYFFCNGCVILETRNESSSMNEAEQYKERLNLALKAAKICVFEVDLSKQLYTFFENAEAIFGVSGDIILNDVQPYSTLAPQDYQRSVTEYFSHPEDATIIAEAFSFILSGQSTTYEARMRAGGSEFIWCKIDVTPIMVNNLPVKMIGVITDITSIKEKTEVLKMEANLDSFTELYNKKQTIRIINNIISKDKNSHCIHALLLLDIDNFKSFNDQYGHSVGDKIILQLSKQLKNSFRKSDVIGRFGGDEFVVFVENIPDEKWLCKKLDSLLHFNFDQYTGSNSIGVSLFPQDATTYTMLFEKADAALYHSKICKGTFTFFSS